MIRTPSISQSALSLAATFARGLALGGLLCCFPVLSKAQTPSQVPITTVVTVLGPKSTVPPPVGRRDVNVMVGKARAPVTGWVAAQGEKAGALQLAILIDDSASTAAVGSQLQELTRFVQSQPRGTSVGVFYATNGTVETASNFNPNHDAAAKALHLPLGRGGSSPSIYLSLSSLVSRWPTTGARREVLLIGTGFDALQPGFTDSYLDKAIHDVERAGIMVHTLYSGSGRGGTTLRGDIGPNNLAQLSQNSGGEVLYNGIVGAVSYAPFLQQLDMVLHNQFLVTYTVGRSSGKKGDFRELKVQTEQKDVHLTYPKIVYVPGMQH
jgi:hypothetical protein